MLRVAYCCKIIQGKTIERVPYKSQHKDQTSADTQTCTQESALSLQWTLSTFAESLNTISPPCLTSVGYQLNGNSVIENIIFFFSQKVICMLDNFCFTDETWLCLTGYSDIQNNRIWSAENPHTLHANPLQRPKIWCWCAMPRKRIVRPLLFEENGEGGGTNLQHLL